MDTNTIIEGTVKFRDGKKWKSRWCVVRKLSPVADCIHLQLYRDSKERYKQGQTKASLSLENFLGIQSGFTLDKESNTLAIICQEVIVVLAFDTREHLMQWQVKISANLGEGDQFLVQISSAPARAKLAPGPARLLIQEFQFCLTVGVPPRLIAFWRIQQLRRFGVVEGKFCFEGGSRCGRGEGLYVLVSEKPEDLTRAFNLAAEGKLFTRKRPVSRNMSVMEKARKHHTFRPESRLSDVSSADSMTGDSPQGYSLPGVKTPSCCCSHSREDLLSWPQTPVTDFPDSISSSETNKFDLSLWSSDVVMGRCTSCMSKLGSMSRSSTLTNTTGNRFPVSWTMDRPKSCGSQKMSPSVTCSSVSLSSHSSQGSCCDLHHRLSAIENCNSVCSSSKSACASTPTDCSHMPPSRPPKPAHLSFMRLQSAPVPDSTTSPSAFLTPSPPPSCCCQHRLPPFTNPYGNYDVPKPLSLTQQKLKLDLKSPCTQLRPQSQSSSEEYYDTPRKLKDSLIWEYGNYDVPPPAQPVIPFSECKGLDLDKSITRETPDGAESGNTSNDAESMYLSQDEESTSIHITKVKLTGEGRMPVMSPCGKIIEKPDLSYEEKLEHLLENESLANYNASNINYANLDVSENNNEAIDTESVHTNNSDMNNEQNYSNIEVMQALQNYENFQCFFSDNHNTDNANLTDNNQQQENIEDNQNCRKSNENICCSNCGHHCSKGESLNLACVNTCENSNYQMEAKNGNVPVDINRCVLNDENSSDKSALTNTFLDNKCNSTSCLEEMKHDPLCTPEKSGDNKDNSSAKASPKYSASAINSPAFRRLTRQCSVEQAISSRFQRLCLRKRSNSVDSSRFRAEDVSVKDAKSTDSHGRSYVLSNPSSTDSLCVTEKLESVKRRDDKKPNNVNKSELKIAPLVISENTDLQETSFSRQKYSSKYSDLIGARSSSVPNKFFSNRDSSSSNDSGVSTGSLSFRPYATDFLEFEMPLTTSMSSKRHHIAMINSNSEASYKMIPKRSKSVDPLRDITFTFEFGEQQNGKSTSAEAEVPVFLLENKSKDYLSPHKTQYLPDSRSTSSGTSDMSDYIETLSFSSFSSLETPDGCRLGRSSAPTMKPRSGKEYHKIDRYLLDQETKE
uniref:Uncharacterized protein n=1 Tax=Homalodisca liturata TaxID=320908 RepID=A0A1B6I0N3_9HEMI